MPHNYKLLCNRKQILKTEFDVQVKGGNTMDVGFKPRELSLKSYIQEKKKMLRDFCLTEEQIESVNWGAVETKPQADYTAKHAIAKYL